jgi:hypothetical protein
MRLKRAIMRECNEGSKRKEMREKDTRESRVEESDN